MRRSLPFLAVLITTVSLMAGCTTHSTLQLDMDLWPLSTFSGYTVHALAYRTGLDTKIIDLNISSGRATGSFSRLASGNWFVQVTVRDAERQICSSGVYIDVVPNMTNRCELLPEPSSGTVVFTLERDVISGYFRVDQILDRILFDANRGRIYIVDNSRLKVGVYSVDPPGKTKDLFLPQAPSAAALSNDGTAILLGFPSGQIYSMNPETGALNLIGDAGMPVKTIVHSYWNYMLLTDGERGFKTMDFQAGSILDQKWFDLNSEMEPVDNSRIVSKIYFEGHGISAIEVSGGKIANQSMSWHPGGFPARLMMNGHRLITASGRMFQCAYTDDQDLVYLGELGYPFVDLVADDEKGYLYLLSTTSPTLEIVNQEDFFTKKSVALAGTPQRVFQTANLIAVIVKQNGHYFMKTFRKSELGL